MENERLVNILYKKLEKEYKEFITGIEKMPSKNIINSAYEITCKSEFVDMFDGTGNYSNDELISLLKLNNTLNELYDDWIHSDNGLHQILEDNASEFINEIVEENKQSIVTNNKELIEMISTSLTELNNYDKCYHLKEHLEITEFSKDTITDVILNGESQYLIEFYKKIKRDKQLDYLKEINVFNSESYENIKNKIIPKLKEYLKEEGIFKEKNSKEVER